MRSAQELDAELRRMRRSMRTVIAAVTFGAFVGIALIVGVVGATLAVVDKNAAQVLKAEPRKAEQAPRKTEQAKAEQAKTEQAKAEQAKAEQAKAEQTKIGQAKIEAAQPPRASAMITPTTTTAASSPAQTNGAASAETKAETKPETQPTPAEAEPRKQAEEQKKADARKRIARTRPETPQAPDVAARDTAAQGAADTLEPRDARAPRRGYARYEGRARTAEDEDRVTVITTQRPRYARPDLARPDLPERPVYEEREAPRGLFGTLFGGRED
jgi:hypothetical protein